jgi:hypothetical protein
MQVKCNDLLDKNWCINIRKGDSLRVSDTPQPNRCSQIDLPVHCLVFLHEYYGCTVVNGSLNEVFNCA